MGEAITAGFRGTKFVNIEWVILRSNNREVKRHFATWGDVIVVSGG